MSRCQTKIKFGCRSCLSVSQFPSFSKGNARKRLSPCRRDCSLKMNHNAQILFRFRGSRSVAVQKKGDKMSFPTGGFHHGRFSAMCRDRKRFLSFGQPVRNLARQLFAARCFIPGHLFSCHKHGTLAISGRIAIAGTLAIPMTPALPGTLAILGTLAISGTIGYSWQSGPKAVFGRPGPESPAPALDGPGFY